MSVHEILRSVVALAPRSRVAVIAPNGERFELPVASVQAEHKPDPMEILSKQLLERDDQTRATVETVANALERMVETAQEVKAAVAGVAAGHDKVAHSVDEMTKTLKLPVKAQYDKAGKLEYAQRK